MDNPTSVLENDTHKLLWEFDIQTDHLISARRPDLIIINKIKENMKIVDFAVSADHSKIKSEKKNKYVDLTRELKKLWNLKVAFIPIIIGALDTVTKGLIKGQNGRLENKTTSGDHLNYCITEITQDAKKSSGDMRRFLSLKLQ